MNEPRRVPLSEELGPYVDSAEAREIDRLGDRLLAERPAPGLGFRVDLRRWVGASAKDTLPRATGGLRLRTAALVYAGAGVVLLAFAALGLTSAGPLAP